MSSEYPPNLGHRPYSQHPPQPQPLPRKWFGSPFWLSLWPVILLGWIGALVSGIKARERGLSITRYVVAAIIQLVVGVMIIVLMVVALAGATVVAVDESLADVPGPGEAGVVEEIDDVTISGCTRETDYGYHNFIATLAVVNDSSKRSTYYVDVDFTSLDGAVSYDTSTWNTISLEPGQSGQLTAESIITDVTDQNSGEYLCTLAKVDRTVDW